MTPGSRLRTFVTSSSRTRSALQGCARPQTSTGWRSTASPSEPAGRRHRLLSRAARARGPLAGLRLTEVVDQHERRVRRPDHRGWIAGCDRGRIPAGVNLQVRSDPRPVRNGDMSGSEPDVNEAKVTTKLPGTDSLVQVRSAHERTWSYRFAGTGSLRATNDSRR